MAGRDKGFLFFVSKTEENYVYLIDGDIHKVENPKRKKIKHIEYTSYHDDSIMHKLKNNTKITNQDVKKALRSFQVN